MRRLHPGPQTRTKSSSLLLVEADREMAEWLVPMLRASGSPDVAHTPSLAELSVRLDAYACAVVDICDATGFELIADMRARAPALPVVTIARDAEQALRSLDAGAQDYVLEAHLDPALLSRSIRYAIERVRADAALAHQALHDPLTGLPNRALLIDRITHALSRSTRQPGMLAVLLLDLDNFKVVNDSLGHDAGDVLLCAVARRLERVLRPSDTVARLGGDEFVVLCEDLGEESHAELVAGRIAEELALPFPVGAGEVFVTASVGIATADGPEDSPARLLRDADAAMYRAKDAGRDRSAVFETSMRERAVERLSTEGSLRRALERDEFRLVYQPLFDLTDMRLVGVEALIRWDHPERGLISPLDFIPLAEETGLIVPIGDWVLHEALRQAREWKLEAPEAPPIAMSVNISPRQLSQPALAETLRVALRDSMVDPGGVTLEITETGIMDDAEGAVAALGALRSQGVRLAIDDFGTGYSSLVYLRRFPVDFLKVDRSFVDGLGRDPEDSAIVSAVTSLAHALGLQVVAEGVETAEHLGHLQDLGCDLAQGFLFAKPQPPEYVTRLLAGTA